MAMISTSQEFLDHYKNTTTLEIGAAITINEEIDLPGNLTITGLNDKASITFNKGIVGSGQSITFENLKLVFKPGDYGCIWTEGGGRFAFINCTIENSGVLIGVPVQQQFKFAMLFTRCKITSADSLAKTFNPDGLSFMTEFSYQFDEKNMLRFEDCDITSSTKTALVLFEKRAYPINIIIQGGSVTASSANNLVYITGPNNDVHLAGFEMPSQMIGCEPTKNTSIHPVFINDEFGYNIPGNNLKSIVSFSDIKIADGASMHSYVGTNAISTDARPDGYTVFLDGKPMPTKYITYQIALFTESDTQKVLDIIWLIEDSPINLVMLEPEPSKHLAVYKAKKLTISGVLNAKSLHLIQSYVNIAGTVTLTEAFTCDVLSYVEGSGTLTANSKTVTLPIKNVRSDSRQPKGPILAATGSAGDGPITNTMIAALIEKFGNRIFMIRFDNGMAIDIGYERSAAQSINDVILENIGGVDMIGVRCRMPNPNQIRHTRQTTGASYISWHPAACVQAFGIMDEGFEMFRPDPMFVI